MRALCLLPLALCASCLRQTEFRCASDNQCNPGGMCQMDVGYCSFSDSACSSGQRFGESAGPYSSQCVGGQTGGDDGGIDGPPIDGLPAGCPGNYGALTGGNPGHVYRKVPGANQDWVTQDNFCRASSARAYLAVPDDAAELTALHTEAGGLFWVGINDRVMEGMFVKSTGGPAVFLPWATGEPDDGGGANTQDCVAGIAATISSEKCGDAHPAVCECEP